MSSKQQQISNAEKFRRECEGRTQSERMLDKFILNNERKEIKQSQQLSKDEILKIQAMKSKTSLFNKNIIEKENSQNYNNQNNNQQNIPNNNLNTIENNSSNNNNNQKQENQKESVKISDAISKVLNHLSSAGKFLKALQILHKLVVKQSQNISAIQSLDILFTLVLNKKFIQQSEQKKLSREIFTAIINENTDPNTKANLVYMTNFYSIYEDQVEILKIFFHDSIDIETDDSFFFNSIVKKLQKHFDELPQYKLLLQQNQISKKNTQKSEQKQENTEEIQQKNQEQSEQENKQQQILSIRDKLKKAKPEQKKITPEKQKPTPEIFNLPDYPYEISENLQNFLDNVEYQYKIKIDLLIYIYEKLLNFYKLDWTQASINQIYSDIQFNKKHMFSKEIQEKIEDCGNLWMDLKNAIDAKKQKINNLNSNILLAGVSKTEVQDARQERVLYDNGVNTWGNKQNGL